MSDTSPDSVAQAQERSRHARERLMGTLGQIQGKLNPMALAQDAVENVAAGVVRDTVETVRARPRLIAAVAGVAVLILARRPVARLIGLGARRATAAAHTRSKRHTASPPPIPKKGSRR